MKSTIYALLAVCMLLATISAPQQALAYTGPKTEKTIPADEEANRQLNEIKRRVDKIKAMDKSSLTKTERKALRKELREMKKRARALGGGGVYLSVGAIIIIILVLILIL